MGGKYGCKTPPQVSGYVVAFRTTVLGFRDGMMRVREVAQGRFGGQHEVRVRCVGGLYGEIG